MLRNSFLLFICLVLVSCSVFGVVCEDNIQPLSECMIVTPSLICGSYTYEVYSNNMTLIESGNLSSYVSNDIFYFNFSKEVGEYLVKLCDDTTGVFFVNYYTLSVFGESFNWLAIILVFIALSGVCLWVSKKITSEDLSILKIFLFYFGMINSFILVALTLFISSGLSVKNFNSYFEVYVILCIILLVLFIFVYFIYWLKKVINEGLKLK